MDDGQTFNEQDVDIRVLQDQLHNLGVKFKKSPEAIAELYSECSGDLNKMRQHLLGKKVVLWNVMEDLALMKPDDSVEFQVLLNSKGFKEILFRRQFMKAYPKLALDQN